ncbi:PQQ-binding-like beta-propeller repeat protein [Polymorphospora rubra]|uniref:outer membrane protein assembly factor BamB family protein n=1 Tax=Polymorphospora rubra TaxID=338584 RepID=UPI0033DDC528
MATGKPRMRFYLIFVLAIVVALAATGVWNPFPTMWDWVNRSQPLSKPDVTWQQRVGGTPKSVTIAGNAVVVEHRTSVEALNLSTGVRLWERKADWSAVAGDAQDPVVAVGKLLVPGYEVLDPATGAVRRKDTEAVAVWTYRNALLDVRCSDPKDCTLTAWDPRGTTPRWSTDIPGVGFVLFADNPDVLGTRRINADGVDAGAAGPEPMPALIGYPIDGRVHVVDTATGRVVQRLEPDRRDRLVVVGGRVLKVTARSEDGTCYFNVEAHDPNTGQRIWQRAGINLRTADGAGCAQREDPQGGLNVIVGIAPDARETVIDAYDGRYLWVGTEGEKLRAVDDHHALVRAADGRSVKGHRLSVDGPRWDRPVHPDAEMALARFAAIVVDSDPDRVIALDPATGRELVNLRTTAKVLAVGPAGMIIGEGRDVGYVPFNGSAPEQQPGGPPGGGNNPGGNGDGSGPCGGAKQPECASPQPKDG